MTNRMAKLICLGFAFVAAYSGTSAFGRQMAVGEAATVREAAPAVVSMSVWKLRPSDQPGQMRRVKTYGSGFVVDPSGIIVTNKHVISDAIDVKAVFTDGTQASAKVIGASPQIDLAIVKVEVGHPLPSLAWGDSDALQVGDSVLSIGNGLGLAGSVSAGIVSGLNRNFGDSPFDNYIQTDATINHGNSGGPLIDREGKVVGVNEALINPDTKGGFIGVGLAIPASTARFVTNHLLDPHAQGGGWLGFNLQDMTPDLAQALAAPRPLGAVVSAVDAGGPAHQASVRPGDILDALDGQTMDDSRAFMRAIVVRHAGEVLHLTIWRSGRKQEVTATVATWPNYDPAGGTMMGKPGAMEMMTKAPDLGVKLAALDDAKRKQYALGPDVSGVLIAHVDADSEASDLGITEGNVVQLVQGTPVATPDDVHRAVQLAHAEHREYLAVLLRSKSGVQWIPISMGGRAP